AVCVLSDHGHRAAGGHGGPEPEVARAPLLARAPGLVPRELAARVEPVRLAATFAAWLGVPAPRAAIGAPARELLPPGTSIEDSEHRRLASLAQQGVSSARLARIRRQRWAVPLAILLLVLLLGPIKRAYGFDRSVPLAIVLPPALAIGLHLAIDRPLSLSAIDSRPVHGVRVAVLGALAGALALGLARWVAKRGDPAERTRRAAACVGLGAFAFALLANAWVGFALGPWPTAPLETYLALYAAGAGASALAVVAFVLFAGALRERAALP
ncbi:MAG TPA: hypothetical protein VIL20_28160, partial [Sandaracinaceae bacterium]